MTRLTDRVGYDGGPFYSRDGTKIVLRSSFPETEEEKAEYLAFLKDGLVVPSALAITVMDRNGKNSRWVTDSGKANFAPFFHPDKAHPVRQQPGCARRAESEPKRRSVFDPPRQCRRSVAETAANGEGVRGRGEICLWISG